MKTLHLILAKRESYSEPLREEVEQLKDAGHSIEVKVGAKPGDVETYAAEAVREGVDAAVAVGGDGTLHDLINGIMKVSNRNCAAGVIPYGTGNDFASSMNIPTDDPTAALRLIIDGSPRLIDVGCMNDHFFINVATGGYSAEITTETSPTLKKFLGKFAYFLTGITKTAGLEAKDIRVTSHEKNWSGKAYVIFIGNGSRTGGRLRVLPTASIDDGLLDVHIVPEMPMDAFMSLMNNMITIGTPVADETSIYFQSTSVDLFVPDGLQMNLDGEPQKGNEFHFSVAQKTLPFYLPSQD